MNKSKLFNKWIADNFSGLSAFTLTQLLSMNMEHNVPSLMFNSYIKDIKELVYVTLYEFFIGKRTDEHWNAYNLCKATVQNCAWL